MATYAKTTSVPWRRSRDEIETTLERYGASQFAYVSLDNGAGIAFIFGRHQFRLTVTYPEMTDRDIAYTASGRKRPLSEAKTAYEQAIRQKWRALLLVVKAKLEAIDAGISTIEQEFFPFLILPSGNTVFEEVAPAVAEALDGNPTPLLQITGG